MTTVDRKRIAKHLAEGMSPVEVSQELSISPSHLSQVMSDETFLILVEEYKQVISLGESLDEAQAREEFHKEMDNYWDEVEALAVDRLKENLSTGLVTKTSELLSISAIANKAVRKKHGSQRNVASSTNNVVQLNISNVLVSRGQVTQTQLNRENQVIEVDGQTIVNANKNSIFDRLKELKDDKFKLEHQELNPEDL